MTPDMELSVAGFAWSSMDKGALAKTDGGDTQSKSSVASRLRFVGDDRHEREGGVGHGAGVDVPGGPACRGRINGIHSGGG